MDSELTLTDYQVEGVKLLRQRGRVILGDDPGLGKSAQALWAIKENNKQRVLIICPATVKPTWAEQIEQWDKGATYSMVSGKLQQREDAIRAKAKYTIINYDVIKKHIDLILKIPYDTIIIDEGHKISNRSSVATKLIFKITAKDKDVDLYIVTGTPYKNHPSDIWSYLHAINPVKFSSYWAWVRKYFELVENPYAQFAPKKPGKILDPKAFKADHERYIIRRRSVDVYGGKETVRLINVPIVMDKDQREIYQSMKKESWCSVHGKEFVADNPLTKLTRLRQICLSPELLINDSDGVGGAKLEALVEFISNHNDKIVLFSMFSSGIKRISKVLNSLGIKTVTITGDRNEQQRIDAREQFKNDPAVRCIAINIDSGGAGLDGLQHASSSIVMLDKHWNPSMNLQAYGRLDRKGQTSLVRVWNFQIKGSVEKRVDDIVRRKEIEIAKAEAGADIPLTSMMRDIFKVIEEPDGD